MPNIQEFDAGNLKLQPTEVGVEARAGTARRIGMFYNQQAGATDTLARETSRLASETSKLGSETSALGAEKGAALSETGRRIGSSISDAGNAAVAYLDHQQISQGAPAFARLMSQKTQEWNDKINGANLNDPTVAQKFMNDSLEPALTKFKEDGFYTEAGQKWAEAHTDALRQHMQEKTQADMMTKQGMASQVNYQQTVNETSSASYNDPSLSNLKFTNATLRSSIEGMLSTGHYTPEVAGRMRTELLQRGLESNVKSAAIGYINKTKQLPPWLNDPEVAPYIKGDEIKMFQKAAVAEQKREDAMQRADELQKKQLANVNVHQTIAKITAEKIKPNPQDGTLIIDKSYYDDIHNMVKNNPDATDAAEQYRTALRFGQEQQKEKREIINDDPETTKRLDDHLFQVDPDTGKYTTVTDLMRANVEKKLSPQGFSSRKELLDQLEKEPLRGPQWASTMEAVKDKLILTGTGLPGKDAVGAANYSAFVQTFTRKYLDASHSPGGIPANALDLDDPKSLISQSLSGIPQRSAVDRMNDALQQLNEATAAQPGAPLPTAAAVKATQSTRMIGDTPVPKSLNGIATLQHSKSTGYWLDQTTNKVYDSKGNEIKQ